jgi:hypothetical protein
VQQSPRFVFFGIGLAVALLAGRAGAASQDAEAQELAEQAIFTDYLQLDFRAAEKKLLDAIKLCEQGTCSPTVQAQVYRDLAVIYITGMKREPDGKTLLVKALRLDSNLALDADLTTPDLIRVFEEAQAEVAHAPTPEPTPRAAARTPTAKRQKAAPAPSAAGGGSMDEDAAADCPPDFPGCDAVPEPREAPKPAEPEEEDEDGSLKNWLSAGLQQDFLMFSGATGVCGTDRPTELSCYRAGDTFRDPAVEGTAGNAGQVAGGFRPATTRLLIGYDRTLFPNISAGVRLGYAIGGGPAEPNGPGFIPVHAELRGSYWFAPLERGKLRPYAALGAGLAQVDSSVTTQVVDRNAQGQIPLDANGNPVASRVTLWKKTGTTFASLGGGALYPLSEHSGISAELKAVLLFPSPGISVSLQAGYSHGF